MSIGVITLLMVGAIGVPLVLVATWLYLLLAPPMVH